MCHRETRPKRRVRRITNKHQPCAALIRPRPTVEIIKIVPAQANILRYPDRRQSNFSSRFLGCSYLNFLAKLYRARPKEAGISTVRLHWRREVKIKSNLNLASAHSPLHERKRIELKLFYAGLSLERIYKKKKKKKQRSVTRTAVVK